MDFRSSAPGAPIFFQIFFARAGFLYMYIFRRADFFQCDNWRRRPLFYKMQQHVFCVLRAPGFHLFSFVFHMNSVCFEFVYPFKVLDFFFHSSLHAWTAARHDADDARLELHVEETMHISSPDSKEKPKKLLGKT